MLCILKETLLGEAAVALLRCRQLGADLVTDISDTFHELHFPPYSI